MAPTSPGAEVSCSRTRCSAMSAGSQSTGPSPTVDRIATVGCASKRSAVRPDAGRSRPNSGPARSPWRSPPERLAPHTAGPIWTVGGPGPQLGTEAGLPRCRSSAVPARRGRPGTRALLAAPRSATAPRQPHGATRASWPAIRSPRRSPAATLPRPFPPSTATPTPACARTCPSRRLVSTPWSEAADLGRWVFRPHCSAQHFSPARAGTRRSRRVGGWSDSNS